MATRYLTILILMLSSTFLLSQSKAPNISTFARQNGLPPMKIARMAIDSSGQLWIGSNTGLHRFDGKQFVTYKSIPKADIGDIEVGHDGTVYVALVASGLAIYNSDEDDFTILEEDEVFKNAEGRYICILVHSSGQVFLSQNGTGIYQIKKEEGVIEPLYSKSYIEYILEYPRDDDKIVLVADSLELLDLNSLESSLITADQSVDAIVDEDGDLWYTNYEEEGIHQINIENGKKYFYSWDSLNPIFENGLLIQEQEIWIASDSGIRVFDKTKKNFVDYYQSLGPATGLIKDPLERIWFGQDNSLQVIDPQNQFFQYIKESRGKTYTGISKIGNDRFLLAPFFDQHFEILDFSKGSLERIEMPEKLREFEYPFDFTRLGKKVFISYNLGILTFDIESQKIEKLRLDKYKPYFEDYTKKELFAGKDGRLWISVFGREVLFKLDTRQMTIDSMHFPKLKDVFTQQLSILENENIVQASEKGLLFINFENKSFELYPYEVEGEDVTLGYIDDIFINHRDIWMLSGSKIYIGIIAEGKIRIYKEVDNSDVFNYNLGLSIEQTDDGDKIILTSSGINVYDKEGNGFAPFGIDEGLINVDRRTRLKRFGDLLFFLSEGISYVRKSDLSLAQSTSMVEINKMEVNGLSVYGQEDYTFPYSSNDIKIGFRSIDLTKPLDVRYKYRISKENPWVYTSYDDTEVLLWDLKAGSYEFEVSAKHLYSDWSPSSKLEFRIQQVIWKRWWFILSVFFLILATTYFFYKRQVVRTQEVANLKTRMAELENEALRAQMNPHFIFNSLNSIKSYIIEHEREDAADYLTNFSDLIRLILANSRQKYIHLDKEIEALKLYMDIENVRLDGKFEYFINNKVENAFIQPLTLQPFIENAIWHGFVHKKESGRLQIDIRREKNHIEIAIEDDGVGRAKSKLIEQKHSRKRSFGILITKERLSQANKQNEILIEDLLDDQGVGRGTRVVISIPHINSI